MRHHAAGLGRITRDKALVDQLGRDYRNASIDAADRAMLDYASKLTRDPAAITIGDVAALRTAGFTDRAILDINLVVGYYAFVNRLAQGLGVPLERFWSEEAPDRA